MLNADISIGDEAGVRACENVLRRGTFTHLHPNVFHFLSLTAYVWKPTQPIALKFAPPNGLLSTSKWRQSQRAFRFMSRKAHHEYRDLAEDMDAAIRRVTGKPYRKLTTQEIADLDVRGLDFSVRFRDIRVRHSTAEELRAQEEAAEALHDASMKLRGQPMPTAGAWFGPRMRMFSP